MASERPPFAVEPEVMAVLEALWTCDHGAYLVGGGVRDALLGLPSSDWDVTTDARPERILEVFPGGAYENRFGTVQARGVEITTFRREHRYADHRRPDSVTFSDDVYEDLARRDLTINAIAWGRRGPGLPARLVDPADGQGDLRDRLVRAVGDPSRRFDEDALRLLRAVRIAARLDFVIEPMTRAAMAAHAADVAWVSEERIGSEVRRMLDMPRPASAFRLLRETGILATTIPELAALAGHQGGGESDTDPDRSDRGEGAFERALAALDVATAERAGDERLALAALLGEGDVTVARRALERLRVANRDADSIATLIEAASSAAARPGEGQSDADLRRYLAGVPPDLVDDLMVLRHARAVARGAGAMAAEDAFGARVASLRASRPPLSLAELAVDGHDLRETLGAAEGPVVGTILDQLLSDVIDDPSLNQRGALLARASLLLEAGAESGDAEPAGELPPS
jgi:tRNA nucleotidyltransferase (CCA-adding enzyme)